MSHRLIVLPDDTAQAILDPINSARHSLNVRMFLFTDKSLLAAVIAAKRRGVFVRVMLNPARRDGTSDNESTREALLAAGRRSSRFRAGRIFRGHPPKVDGDR